MGERVRVQTRGHVRHTLGVEMVKGMAVGMWESEGTDKGEGGVEAIGSRQPEERGEKGETTENGEETILGRWTGGG